MVATAKLTAVIGRNPRPAWKAVKPRTSCISWVVKKKKPIIAPRYSARAAYAPDRRRSAKSRSGMIGCSARRSWTTRTPEHRDRHDQRCGHHRVGPAAVGRLDDPEHERADADGGGQRTGQVEPAALRAGGGQVARREDGHRDAERHVDEEPGAPGDPLRGSATDQQAQAGADARGRGVPGHGARALLSLGEARGQQRQCRGRHDGRADTLQRSAGDQPRPRRRDTDEERRGHEHSQAGDEDPAAAEQVAEPGAEQEEPTEHERVGVLDPRQAGGPQVHRRGDARQPGEDHRVVQEDQEVADQDDRQDRPRVRRTSRA